MTDMLFDLFPKLPYRRNANIVSQNKRINNTPAAYWRKLCRDDRSVQVSHINPTQGLPD